VIILILADSLPEIFYVENVMYTFVFWCNIYSEHNDMRMVEYAWSQWHRWSHM